MEPKVRDNGLLLKGIMITEFALGLFAGAFLGLLGGGGSVIAVPMLVYVLGLGTKSAIGTSLLVVALASTVGSYTQYREGLVDIKIATIFGFTGAITSLAGALIARSLPDVVQMYILAGLMFASATAMIFRTRQPQPASANKLVPSLAAAAFVGVLTGIVGVGGGFLLVPALTIMMGLALPAAIATSLVIVAANSTIAGLAYLPFVPRDLSILFFALGMSIACPLIGRVTTRLNERLLRRVFSVLLVLLACFILFKEV